MEMRSLSVTRELPTPLPRGGGADWRQSLRERKSSWPIEWVRVHQLSVPRQVLSLGRERSSEVEL
nr:hypothetical protein [uncultured bacterium]